MPQGFAVEDAQTVEIIAAWSSQKTFIYGVAASPGWQLLGQYFLPKSCAARLDVVHLVSASGLTSRVRLWDVDARAAVGGSVSSVALSPERSLGGRVQLVGGRSYQVQAECTGGVGADKFGVSLSATISD